MNIRDLEYLVALYELRGFREAARACNASQPAISISLKRLEDELDILLINRTTRTISFTNVGEEIVNQARNILSGLNTLKEIARKSDYIYKEINLGIPYTFAHYIFDDLQRSTAESKSSVLNVHELSKERILSLLNKGFLNCAVLPEFYINEHFDKTYLTTEPLFLAVSNNHRLCSKKFITSQDLKGETVLKLTEDNNSFSSYQALSTSADALKIGSLTTSFEMLKKKVALNTGVALIPMLAVEKNENYNITYLSFEGTFFSRKIYFIYRRNSPERASLLIFARKLKEIFESKMRTEI